MDVLARRQQSARRGALVEGAASSGEADGQAGAGRFLDDGDDGFAAEVGDAGGFEEAAGDVEGGRGCSNT